MKRTLIKSCCGGHGFVLELENPVQKNHLQKFLDSGFATNDTYTRVGVFYVTKTGLTASAPYGGTKIQVRCGGSANCSQMMDNLENTFKELGL